MNVSDIIKRNRRIQVKMKIIDEMNDILGIKHDANWVKPKAEIEKKKKTKVIIEPELKTKDKGTE